MCWSYTALYPSEDVSWYPYALFVNGAGQIKANCNYEVKYKIHNVAYNLNKNLWAISSLSTQKLQNKVATECLH